MSSAFDKEPERRPDDEGQEDTRSYGQPVPPAPAGPPGYGPPSQGYGPPPAYEQGYGAAPGYPPPPGYGPPPAAYGSSPAGYPAPGYAVPDHPKATTSMVLGILGVVLCQVVAPFAWVIGKRTLGEIDASGGRWGGRGQAQAGYVLGIVGTVLLGLSIAVLAIYAVVALVALGGLAAGAG